MNIGPARRVIDVEPVREPLPGPLEPGPDAPLPVTEPAPEPVPEPADLEPVRPAA